MPNMYHVDDTDVKRHDINQPCVRGDKRGDLTADVIKDVLGLFSHGFVCTLDERQLTV